MNKERNNFADNNFYIFVWSEESVSLIEIYIFLFIYILYSGLLYISIWLNINSKERVGSLDSKKNMGIFLNN